MTRTIEIIQNILTASIHEAIRNGFSKIIPDHK